MKKYTFVRFLPLIVLAVTLAMFFAGFSDGNG